MQNTVFKEIKFVNTKNEHSKMQTTESSLPDPDPKIILEVESIILLY